MGRGAIRSGVAGARILCIRAARAWARDGLQVRVRDTRACTKGGVIVSDGKGLGRPPRRRAQPVDSGSRAVDRGRGPLQCMLLCALWQARERRRPADRCRWLPREALPGKEPWSMWQGEGRELPMWRGGRHDGDLQWSFSAGNRSRLPAPGAAQGRAFSAGHLEKRGISARSVIV
jgi:hypothetical protein